MTRQRTALERWVSMVALVLLLATAWPGPVRGQGPRPAQDMEAFLLQRIREPGFFPRYQYAPACVTGQAGAPAAMGPIGDWSRLTFASTREGNWEIYTARGDGTQQTRLTTVGAPDLGPELYHGASAIVFVSKRTVDYEVHKMNADGSGVTRLTYSSDPKWLPSWSRDGSRVAFFAYPGGNAGNAEIYTMNADGSGLQRLTYNSSWDGHPTWSPDGTRIAFISDRSGGVQVWTMNADGSNQQQLTTGLRYTAFPAWSPDGTRIALNDDFNSDGYFDLALINADGSGLTHPLGASPATYDNAAPAWAPHGDALAFFRVNWTYRGSEDTWYWINADIYRLDLNSGATDLLVGSHCDWFPDWKATDVTPPTSQVEALPAFAQATFPVTWGGSDDAAGVRSYDIQVRDGPSGAWTDWLLDTTATSANFTGVDAHTYYFRSRARDHAYNLEAYPTGNGDAWITVDTTPPDSSAASPFAANGPFTVTWSASDAGSGVDTYDIQVRDGPSGVWSDWILDTTATSALFTNVADAHTYYFRSRARDQVGNVGEYPTDPDTATLVDFVPPTSQAGSPEYALATTFVVTWTGSDVGAGVASYDIQVRDGITGTWQDWLLSTTQTQAAFSGQLGHAYYFQSRAWDRAGNVEEYPGGDGDTVTYTPRYQLDGHVLDIRENPIAGATVEAAPLGLTTTLSGADGAFSLFFNLTGTVDLSAAHPAYGAMPPMHGIAVLAPPPAITFYLPPAEDAIADGGFEAGDLAAWTLGAWQQPGEVAPVLTGTAHTGDYGVPLGGVVPPPVVSPTEGFVSSALISEAGGVLTSPLVVAEIPPGAVSGTVQMTLRGIPTIVGIPAGKQDVGLHFAWQVALTDGTPVDATLLPVTLTLTYRDILWRDAQVDGEASLDLWRLELDGFWYSMGAALDPQANTATIATTEPRTFALLGDAYEAGPWTYLLEQDVTITPTSFSGAVGLIYRVVAPPQANQLWLVLRGSGGEARYAIPTTLSDWVHRWWELPEWAGPTLTVRLEWVQAEHDGVPAIVVDEVAMEVRAIHSIYLPVIFK